MPDESVFITREIPKGYEFGIDFQSYVVGELFIGVKAIPPGFHYIFCAPREDVSFSRSGFVHFFKEEEIVVREWDESTDSLRVRNTSDAEKDQVKKYYAEVERFLTSYEIEQFERWSNLTDMITEKVSTRLAPATLIIRSCGELEPTPNFDRSTYNAQLLDTNQRRKKFDFLIDDDVNLPYLQPVKNSIPNFTDLPDRCPKNSTPSEITRHHMDCGDAVDRLVAAFDTENDILAEIQFSYAIFLGGYSIEGLTQWRKFLLLFSNSSSAVAKYANLYRKYLHLLRYQVLELPDELMQATPNNTVHRDVKQLIINCCELNDTKNEALRLTETLKKNMLWFMAGDNIFDCDPDDEPTVVEIV